MAFTIGKLVFVAYPCWPGLNETLADPKTPRRRLKRDQIIRGLREAVKAKVSDV
jgi:hypothetical protein